MIKWVIKLILGNMSDAQLEIFANEMMGKMSGNTNYTTPNPTLIMLGTLITAFHDALAQWGSPPGNRGSTLEHQNVLDTRAALEVAITSLANYCMNTTPYEKAAFLSGGWLVKKQNTPVGLVGPVVALHQFISRTVQSGAVKLNWKRPLEAPKGSIDVYRVMNGLTPDINMATQIGLTRRPTFTDLDAGNRASNYYWVIPVCTAGNGGIADVVHGYPQGPVLG